MSQHILTVVHVILIALPCILGACIIAEAASPRRFRELRRARQLARIDDLEREIEHLDWEILHAEQNPPQPINDYSSDTTGTRRATRA